MQKLSGLVLDQYDDDDGAQLRTWYPTRDDVPDFIKYANRLSPEDHGRLPDESFALVMIDGDKVLRKYACIDEGNVVLSVDYFMMNGHKIPEEAQKVAAANLITACKWYDLEPPEGLKKVAFGGLLMAGLMAPGAAREVKANLAAAKTSGGTILTPKQVKQRRMQMGI